MKKWTAMFAILGGVSLMYIVVAFIVYSFRHPEKTDTQRLLEFVDLLEVTE